MHPSSSSPTRRHLRSLYRKSLPPKVTAVVVLLISLAMTLLAWERLDELEQTRASTQFSREASRISTAMEKRLEDYAQALRSGAAFLHGKPHLSRQAWHQLGQDLALEHQAPGLMALGYLPRLTAAELPAFIQQMRDEEGLKDFALVPAGPRREYFPAAYVVPEAPVRPALGFDVGSDPSRRQTLDIARDNGSLTLSGPLNLVMDAPQMPASALMLALPLYRSPNPPHSQDARRTELTGYVFAVFRVGDFISSLGHGDSTRVDIQITDTTDTLAAPLPLYGAIPPGGRVSEELPLLFGGRSWQVRLQERESPGEVTELPGSQVLLFSGTAISLLLALLTLRIGNRRALAEQLAQRLSHQWAQANTRLISVLDSLPDLMFELDRNRRFRHYHAPNPEDLFVPPSTLLHRHVREVLPPNLAVQIIQHCDEIDQTGQLQILEYQLPRGDGKIGEYEARMTAIGDDGYLMVIRNVSEIRRAQQALLNAHTRMKAVFDAATEVAIITTDMAGLITVFNRGAEKMLGYRSEAIVGKSMPVILHLPEEIEARGSELSREFGWKIQGFEVFATRARLTGAERREWTYVRQDGSHLTVSLVITAVYDEANNVSGFLGVAVDITALKSAEAELRRHRDHLQELVTERSADLLLAKEAAECANQTKSEFLANMSHELRTPMHAILSFAGLGAERASAVPGAGKLHHYFLRIRESGERLLALVNDLLDLSKLEAGKMSFAPRPVNLRPLVQEAALEMESLLQEKTLHLAIDLQGPAEVLCDPLRFGQLIRNLLSNAIKFSPAGGLIQIRFRPARLSTIAHGEHPHPVPAVEMTVCDEGIGIPIAERELVFDKFAQSSKTKTGAGGTGLGLAICREIALAHRGTIEARGNDGPGTCLAVILPTPDAFASSEEHS